MWTNQGARCNDSQKQQNFTHKDDASSPTVSTAALMLSCVVDAKEKRQIAAIDVPNTFVQTDMDDLMNMKIDKTMSELFVKINQSTT
eukprot:13552052-Ditylum_brightwellii.AAC.1